MFEFYRNKEFFENLLEEKLDIKKPFINLKPKKLDFKLPNKYAILFIGASANFRKWDAKMGAIEIIEKLQSGELEKSIQTITLKWYQELIKWHKIIKDCEKYGGILEI